jgi:hypothetical protein
LKRNIFLTEWFSSIMNFWPFIEVFRNLQEMFSDSVFYVEHENKYQKLEKVLPKMRKYFLELLIQIFQSFFANYHLIKNFF